MQSVLGDNVAATYPVFNDDITLYGARIEVPETRAIATAWTPASKADGLWHVTLESPVAAGDYNIVFMDEFGAYQFTVPLLVGTLAMATTDWPEVDEDAVRPGLDDVAVLERNRIISDGGVEMDTWDETTRPTADDVEQLIETSLTFVLVQLPTNRFDPEHYATVRSTVALQAAVLVESSFFRETIDQGSSALYLRMLQSNIISLNAKIIADARVGTGRDNGTALVRLA